MSSFHGYKETKSKSSKNDNEDKQTQRCLFFNKPEDCKFGDKCKFLHSNPGKKKGKDSGRIQINGSVEDVVRGLGQLTVQETPNCRFFNSPEGCSFGDKCKYLHDKPSKKNNSANTSGNVRNKSGKVNSSGKTAVDEEMFASNMSDLAGSVSQAKAEKAKANMLDLVIVMDCTGSMSSWIASAHEKLFQIIRDVKDANKDLTIRIAFVAYRDHCDGAQRIASIELSEDHEAVKTFIKTQRATGGGDGPEDIPGGIEAALKLDWKAGACAMVLVYDAPCHGSKYHISDSDSEYSIRATANEPTNYIELLSAQLATKGVDVMAIEIDQAKTKKMTDFMEQAFNNAPLPSDGNRRKFLRSSLTDATKLGVTVASFATSSVSDSILRAERSSNGKLPSSPSSSSSSNPGLLSARPARRLGKLASMAGLGNALNNNNNINNNALVSASTARPTQVLETIALVPQDSVRLNQCKWERAVRYSYYFKPNVPINWANPELSIARQETRIRIDESPFARGGMRTAHLMEDLESQAKMVGKVYFKHVDAPFSERRSIVEQDTRAQAVAKQIAKAFSQNACVPKAVDFIRTSCYELIDRDESSPFRVIGVEPLFEGNVNYVKYNNNNGWTNEKSGEQSSFGDVANAFSHYSWQHTNGSLLVVDLQGVNYVMTDPQIHTRDARKELYGFGNLGDSGMVKFFASHKCNDICRALCLQVPGEGPPTAESVAAAEAALAPLCNETNMEISCFLCGCIQHVSRSEFNEEAAAKRWVYCIRCKHKMNDKQIARCEKCNKETPYSPYWYKMMAMDTPKACKQHQ